MKETNEKINIYMNYKDIEDWDEFIFSIYITNGGNSKKYYENYPYYDDEGYEYIKTNIEDIKNRFKKKYIKKFIKKFY